MPLVATKQALDEAAKGKYAVGAFSAINLEQTSALFQAASDTESPLILQISSDVLPSINPVYFKHMALAGVESHPDVFVALHLHGARGMEDCRTAVEYGFTSAGIVAQGPGVSSGDAFAGLKEMVRFLHERGVAAELTLEASLESGALEALVEATGCDIVGLASADEPAGDMARRLSGARFSAAGAADGDLGGAASRGFQKISVEDTLWAAYEDALRQALGGSGRLTEKLNQAREATRAACARIMNELGQTGRSNDYEPMALDEFRRSYAAAEH